MARRNRVTPFGEIVAVPERGTFMGNRGVLHDGEGRIKRACRHSAPGRWPAASAVASSRKNNSV